MNDMCWVQVGSCFSGSCCRQWPYFWRRAHQPIKSEIRGMGATEASDISRRSTCSGNPEEVPACQKSDKKTQSQRMPTSPGGFKLSLMFTHEIGLFPI